MCRTRRVAAALVLAGVVAGCGSSRSDGPGVDVRADEPDVTFEVSYRDGAVVGGPQLLRAEAGDVVRISIEGDEADEVHVHGIDVSSDLPAGAATAITFEARDTGNYEVELHGSGALLGTLEVR